MAKALVDMVFALLVVLMATFALALMVIGMNRIMF
jgi:hypothetical protein